MAKSPPPLKIVNSTLIQSYSYDSEAYTLSVSFKDGTDVDYYNVMPPVVSSVFDSPGSVGSKFLKQVVKAGYRFVRTEPS